MYPSMSLQTFLVGDDERRDPRAPLDRPSCESGDEEPLPSGHRRSEYHAYGYTDDHIDLWGLDRPGAPSPDAVWRAVMDLLDEIE